MPEHYHYVRETFYNNNGKFGSDIIEYILYNDNKLIGSMIHDFYENRSVIKYKEDRLVFIKNWFSAELKSKNTGKVIARFKDSHTKLIINDPPENYIVSIGNSQLYKNKWQYKLHGQYSETTIEVKKELPPNTSIRLIPFFGNIHIKGKVNFLAILMSFISLEQMIYLEVISSD